MFNKTSAANEIAETMQKELVAAVVEKEVEPLNKYAVAMEALNKAAEILDEIGLSKEAEYTTTLLEVVARKKKAPKSKSKSKSRKPAKKSDPETKGLTSEKMVQNLEHKGWVFNADDDKKHSHGCMCSMCMDVNDVRHGDDCVCSLCMDADDWESHYKLEANDTNNAEFDILALDPRNRKGIKVEETRSGKFFIADRTGKVYASGIGSGDEALRLALSFIKSHSGKEHALNADDNFHFDTRSDASHHIDHNSANDWNLSDIFGMDFEDEIDLPKPRR